MRARLTILGAVQGVGFRPTVFRLATELGLAGWVNNSAQGVSVELEGAHAAVLAFILRIEKEKPPRSFIQSFETTWLAPAGYREFEIRASEPGGAKTALVLPDTATCPDCLREIFDPANRRFHYPFTNCTHCGPRFTIIEALPYDRPNTSMRAFEMCAACQAEYDDPRDRRFHAQPNACPVCGPRLELWDRCGAILEQDDHALEEAANGLGRGAIVAVKGLGGFHLMADARNEATLRRLRELKHREEKPFALMAPTLESIRAECVVSDLEERLICSPEAPIVLLRRKPPESDTGFQPVPSPSSSTIFPPPHASQAGSLCHVEGRLAPAVAPGNPCMGVMLPSNPLHHLLLARFGFTVVATSGNLADEPICTDEREALDRLGAIADLLLVHNRRIVRHVDDSIVRVMLDRELVLRRARGYAPLPVHLAHALEPTLAVGAHLKNTVALSAGNSVFVSQHIGDLETEPAMTAFRRVIADFERLYETRPVAIVADTHPEYLSTKFARELARQTGTRFETVQHHYAHIRACMAENEIEGPALGIAWDGTGYGSDGTIWGGEFLEVTDTGFERLAHIRAFPLPGGEAAIREPRRCALGLLYEVFGDEVFLMTHLPALQSFSSAERTTLRTMLQRSLNSPRTSSVGRLFDAVASLAGARQITAYEGQSAMDLEFAAVQGDADDYAFRVSGGIVDWKPMIRAILADAAGGVSAGVISGRFHRALAEVIVTVARIAGKQQVVLSGGCFQNEVLTRETVQRLRAAGFTPVWHQRIPPNDGGIALGQIMAAGRREAHPTPPGAVRCQGVAESSLNSGSRGCAGKSAAETGLK